MCGAIRSRGKGPGLVFLGHTVLIPHARPDVAAVFPGYPNNDYGWGTQVLTNELPAGNGKFKLHVLATNGDGTTEIGTRTITVDNAHSQLPFGSIDTPAQGQTISGSSFVNFGWVVTPNPLNVIPKDGSTIVVYVDNKPVAHPVYNNYRSDIAAAFPGLQNSNGAVGYYIMDTTKLTNGQHTIAWSVTDSAGNTQGIGSRVFFVQN